jgi:hypothetical protein
VPRNVLGNIGVRPYHRNRLRRFGANVVAAAAATAVIAAGVAVVTLNRDREPAAKEQTWTAEAPAGKKLIPVDEDAAIVLSGKTATGPANLFAKGPPAGDDTRFWEEVVSWWRSRQKPDAVAVRVLNAHDEAAQVEMKLTAPRATQKTDPIDAAIHRAAGRIDALEREVAPVCVLRVEVHEHTEKKSQSQPRKVK